MAENRTFLLCIDTLPALTFTLESCKTFDFSRSTPFNLPRAVAGGYPLRVRKASSAQSSPTTALLLGLVLTLTAVLVYSFYTRSQLAGLRVLQSDMVDRNRRDSLQLLRVQNDLNSLGLAMRDMLDSREPYPLTAWSAQFQRIREDLDAALKL